MSFVFLLGNLAPGLLTAQEKRGIPLDLCLIVDGSAMFSEGKAEALNWINRELIDGILQENDKLTIWSAGDSARIIYSETVGSQKDSIRNTLKALETTGQKADFAGALRETASGGGANQNREPLRMSVTMLVSGSARAMSHSMASDPGLFRWSMVDEYSGWQVLVTAPGIGPEVRRAAAAYMSYFK
ncbi:MAG: hypothetical protein LBH43_06860 [Treponema sp.]|nr:hypothetical protein [Treponema sp.]